MHPFQLNAKLAVKKKCPVADVELLPLLKEEEADSQQKWNEKEEFKKWKVVWQLGTEKKSPHFVGAIRHRTS